MIYLITGLPGSGKTLYALSTLLKTLMADKVKGDDGKMVERRLLVDGVPDLILDHVPLAPGNADGVPLQRKDSPAENTDEPGCTVHNWMDWCKPGDIIFIDEVQRYWRPRGLGTKPPPEIQALETHRHRGVDFVIITQNPMLLDQNVRRLVNRHTNVRRAFGMARAVLYDWDGCQSDVNRTGGCIRSSWSYPKDAFKLYTSAEQHTKQRQKIPLWLAFPVVVLALGAVVVPYAYAALTKSTSGVPVVGSKPPAANGAATGPAVPASGGFASSAVLTASIPADDVPEFVGCVRSGPRCICYDADANRVDTDPGVCESETSKDGPPKTGFDLAKLPEVTVYVPPSSDFDLREQEQRYAVMGDVIKSMRSR